MKQFAVVNRKRYKTVTWTGSARRLGAELATNVGQDTNSMEENIVIAKQTDLGVPESYQNVFVSTSSFAIKKAGLTLPTN